MNLPLFKRKPSKLRATATLPRRTAQPAREELEDDEPTMRLSSAFVVVLLLHLVAVGGIYAFNSIKAHHPAASERSAPITPVTALPKTAQELSDATFANGTVTANTDTSPRIVSVTPTRHSALANSAATTETGTHAASATPSKHSALVNGTATTETGTHAASATPSKHSALANGTATAETGTHAASATPSKHSALANGTATAETGTHAASATPSKHAALANSTATTETGTHAASATPSKHSAETPDVKPLESPAKPPAVAAASKQIEDSGLIHVVIKGENPVTIARKAHVSYEALLKLNHIHDSKKMQIGQKLHLPKKLPPTDD